MARTRATAVSAMVLTLGLTGIGVIPFVGAGATASATALNPVVEPCDVGQVCPPETTVTITTTLPTPTPEPEQPETTITKTVTAKPTRKTQNPQPTKTKTTTKAPEPDPPPATQPVDPPPQVQPTQTAQEVPDVTTSEPEESVEMPTVAGSDTPTPPLSTDVASVESDTVQWEVRNAAPEYDQRSLTQQLSIPALIMVLLVLFAVLIFEGRLRRMAHAAAVRKAGPQAGIHPPGPYPGQAEGYPAGPGYATAGVVAPGYPGGTAYAPIISFVPVQTFPSGQVQYGAVYHDPNVPAPQEPVVLAPDPSGSYTHRPDRPSSEPQHEDVPGTGDASQQPGGLSGDGAGLSGEPEREGFRAPFEPLIPPEPSSGIPPGGAGPYEDTPDRPLGPASAAEPGDSEPWGGPLPSTGLDRTVEQRFPDDPGPNDRRSP